MGDLVVELYGQRVGRLVGSDWRSFDFVADAAGIRQFGLGSTVLGECVPLDARPVRGRADRRRNFFGELLPEGEQLVNAADRIRVSTTDVIGMLRAYGRDVAGAVQIWDPEQPGEPRTPRLERLTDHQVEMLLSDLGSMPLGNHPMDGKSSLAGVQPKAVLARVDDTWNQVLDGYPSTHILKPELARNPTVIFDEEYGSRFARALGLAEFSTSIVELGSLAALSIERYDRDGGLPDGRVHQEDMNQVLGVRGSGKYQERGDGAMALARIAAVFARRGDRQSLRRLHLANVLAVGVGNLDMHGKNLSLLHPLDRSTPLAPIYDVVPLAHHADLDGRMALAVNSVYAHRDITLDDLIAEGVSWGIRGDLRAETIAALERMRELAESDEPDARAWPGLRDDILGFVSNLLAGRAAGSPRSSPR